MKKSLVLAIVFCAFYGSNAQDKAKPAPAPEAKPETIKIKAELALEARDAQIQAMLLQQQVEQAQRRLQAAIQTIYTENKVTREDYTIDDAKWNLVKLVKPELKAEEKKPEEKKK